MLHSQNQKTSRVLAVILCLQDLAFIKSYLTETKTTFFESPTYLTTVEIRTYG